MLAPAAYILPPNANFDLSQIQYIFFHEVLLQNKEVESSAVVWNFHSIT